MRKILIILFLGINSVLSATDYYVKNSGSDSNSGLDDNNAWANHPWMSTWTGSAKLVPGDRVFMKRGNAWTISNPTEPFLIVSQSGSENNYITTSAYGTGIKPIISIITNSPKPVIYAESKSFIVFDNLEIKHYSKIQNLGYYHGIAVTKAPSSPHDWIITNCHIHNCPNSGISIGGDAYNITIGDLEAKQTATRTAYSNNIYDCGYAGVVMGGCNPEDLISNYKIYYNYIHDINVSGDHLSNAYGIVFSSDASSAGPTNFCYTRYNFVENIPTWHGLNCHNGKNMYWQDNYVSNCLVAIATAPNERGGDWRPVLNQNYIERNIIKNSSSHPYGDYLAIAVAGESPVYATDCFIRDNNISYESRPSDETSSCAVNLNFVNGCSISGNYIFNGPTLSGNGALMLSRNLQNISIFNNFIKDWSPAINITPSSIDGSLNIYNNIIQNFGNAISCEGTGLLAGDLSIYNNTILCATVDNYYVPLRLYLNELPIGTSINVKNNIIGFPVSTNCIYIKSPKIVNGTYECDYNLYWNSSSSAPFALYDKGFSIVDWQSNGYDIHSLHNTDPKIKNNSGDYMVGDDFELLPESPAINKALVLNTVTEDFLCKPRDSAPDIGAFEFISSFMISVTDIIVNGNGGINTISTNKGTLQLLSSVLPSDATNKAVNWSLTNGTGQATISSSGLVTAIANGIVTAKALASDGSGVSGIFNITITNQEIADTPVYVSSVIENTFPSIIEINYSLPLSNIVPSPSAFSVQVDSVTRSVSSISISGTKVSLNLSSPVAYGNAITVAYTKPSINPIQTSAGVQAASLTSQTVINKVAAQLYPVVPVYVISVIENEAPSRIEITYNLALANIVPATSAFSVQVNSTNRSVSLVSVSGTKVSLTLSSPVVYGNTVTVAYSKPSINPLQTSAGSQAASISSQTVRNKVNAVTPPPPVVVNPPIEPNTPPVIDVSYIGNVYSGFVYVLDASDSYDKENGNLVFSWKIPSGVSVSSTTMPLIQFLAPVVTANQTFEFQVTVSDGKTSQSKTVPVQILPYQPDLETAKVISIEASTFKSPDSPDNVLDGNKGTLWSASGTDQWIILKLEETFNIHHLKLAFQPGQKRESYFEIYGSRDKENWEMILSNVKSCAFSGDLQIFDFPVSKREIGFKYLKLAALGNSTDTWNYISEFGIFGFRQKKPTDYEDQIVKIYPNPAKDIVNILIEEPSFFPDFIRVASLTGKVFCDGNIDFGIRQLQIPVDFRPGVYIIQMGIGEITMFTGKLIITQ